MKRYKFLIFIVLLSFIAPIADTEVHGQEITADYYISPSGSDSNPCSLSEPCQTIAHAQTVVQTAIAGGLTAPVNVYLRGGTYTQSTGLTFGAADSGTGNNPVTWQAYPGEVPVISGGQAITGWVPDTGSIYKTYVGTDWNFRQLYVNGVHAQRARGAAWPAGWERTGQAYTTATTAMAGWRNPTAIEIVSHGPWSMDRCKVASIGAPEHIYAPTTLPPEGSVLSAPYELGVQFTADTTGQVTQIRHWRMAGDTGAHAVHLWDTEGTLLATGTLSASSDTGWQTAAITPVSIVANTPYIASVSLDTNWPYWVYLWNSPVSSVNLHTAIDAARFSNTMGNFPDQISSNGYFVDIGFVPTAVTPVVVQEPCWANQNTVLSPYLVTGAPAWIENAYELMASGSWYLDTAAGYLYYWPPGGTMAGLTVVAPTVAAPMTVTDASNLTFKNLTFSYSNWIDPDSGTGYIGLQDGYTWAIAPDFVPSHGHLMGAAVTVSGSNNITFEGNMFSHLGSRALLVYGASSSVTIAGNTFADNAGGAIQVGDVANCPAVQETGIVIAKNVVVAGDAFDYTDNSGIFAPCMSGSSITGNEVAAPLWSGIAVGWGWSATPYASALSIANNYVHDFCSAYNDCGAIYANGQLSVAGTYLSGLAVTGNYISNLALAGTEPASWPGICLYADNYAAWETWSGNICQVSHVWLQNPASSSNLIVSGNWWNSAYVYEPTGSDITVSGSTVVNNTVQPFGTPAQAVICAAGVPGATACTTPKLWPQWQAGVGATWSKPQIGP